MNCSLFNPTPSLAAIVINHYKMKDSIQSYSLGGMGCSAGIIAVHLAKDLLQVGFGRWLRCPLLSRTAPLLRALRARLIRRVRSAGRQSQRAHSRAER